MRWLTDENIPRSVVTELRSRGHDVATAREIAPGAPDHDLLGIALHMRRVILTFDQDFGREVFGAGRAATLGVVLLRIEPAPGTDFGKSIVDALASRQDWPHHFSVIEHDHIRMTPLREHG